VHTNIQRTLAVNSQRGEVNAWKVEKEKKRKRGPTTTRRLERHHDRGGTT